MKNRSRLVGKIAKQLPISVPSVSYHLSIFGRSRLVSSDQLDRYIFYKSNPLKLRRLFHG
ncbi:ArsR family transcriptional regulator [Roseburia sp. 1XD42-69]|uniref:ArsR family transcriptional regulator n=1 Tax=Roseburia sp. 1XD42-69 TaxID=2320088 RepID=UPI000EA27CDB|nr:transcriptional regulator [Roseburia sp. 1XD42-69]